MDLPIEIGQKVGVLGGTFDPVHNGHLRLVDTAVSGLGLDSLVMIPAATPPHKRDLPVTPLEHRLAMLKHAIAGRQGLYVSGLEAERPGPSFSIDTLSTLRNHFTPEAALFFVVGFDAFVEIHTWKYYQQLPMLADLVVVDRAGAQSLRIGEVVNKRFVGYLPDNEQGVWRGPGGIGVIRYLAMAPVAVSSTKIREMAASGLSLADMVPAAVENYIHTKRLYCA